MNIEIINLRKCLPIVEAIWYLYQLRKLLTTRPVNLDHELAYIMVLTSVTEHDHLFTLWYSEVKGSFSQ